jgi:uncharacterized coiled-coil DUF342 family protein
VARKGNGTDRAEIRALGAERERDALREELEQPKKERDELKAKFDYAYSKVLESCDLWESEVKSLRSQLAEKDKEIQRYKDALEIEIEALKEIADLDFIYNDRSKTALKHTSAAALVRAAASCMFSDDDFEL